MEVTEFQLSYTKSLKMMGLMCCTQYVSKFGKLSSGHRTGKDVLIPISVKGNAPKCLNYCTVGLITHASKFMLKIFKGRLQYVNIEHPDILSRFQRGRGSSNQIANVYWIMEKANKFQKNSYFCFIEYTKAFDCVYHNKL